LGEEKYLIIFLIIRFFGGGGKVWDFRALIGRCLIDQWSAMRAMTSGRGIKKGDT